MIRKGNNTVYLKGLDENVKEQLHESINSPVTSSHKKQVSISEEEESETDSMSYSRE